MKGFTLSGKAILIIITAITTAGGFTLGYFVGKNTSTSTAQGIMPVMPQQSGVSSPAGILKREAKEDMKASPEESSAALLQTRTEAGTGPKITTPMGSPESHRLSGADNDAGSAAQENKPTPEKRLYTVQAGAFRNQRDADSLMLKLKKKGYAAYVRKDTGSKGITLFKVRIGEFTDKKKAETLARELKKTQGLNAFAAVKN